MINIRSKFTPVAIDKLPLPEVMKTEIKKIPSVHCEYQHTDGEIKCDNVNLQSPDSEMAPLAQSSSLITKGTSPTFHTKHSTDDGRSSSDVHLVTNSSIKPTADEEDSRTEVITEIISQYPTNTGPSSVRNKTKKKGKMVQVN